MQSKSTNKFILLWLFIILPVAAAIVFRKSFDLGLYGDDWQHLYILWREFFVFHNKSFFDITSYLNPYWPEYLYLGIIEHFWGYFPPAYFIASYLCRLFANIALYFLSYELTKSKLAAFLTTLIFLVSAAGLQTTDWVFNMNTYFGLGLLAIASTIYLKIRKLKTFKSWLYPAFVITFTLGLAVVPTRMHGATPFIILTDLFLTYLIERQQFKFNKYVLLRMGLTIIIFLALVHFKSFGEGSYTSGRFNDSYKLVQTLMQNGYYSWWLYFLAIIGHLVLPDNINFTVKSTLKSVLIVGTFLSILFASVSSYSILKSKKIISYLPILIFNIGWLIFLFVMSKADFHTSSDIYFAIFLGWQFLFWAIWFYLIGRKNYPDISKTLIISIIWIVSLTILHWLFTPYYIIETTGRYMTMGAAGTAIFFGALSALLLKQATFYASNPSVNLRFLGILYLGIPLLILLIFIITNFQAGQKYLNVLHETRNKELTESTWKTLLSEVPVLDPDHISIFYFTTDNPLSLEGVLVFGFYMRAGLEWKIPLEHLTPLPVKDYNELLEYVKDGSPAQKIHGRKAEPIPLSKVYAFDFRGGELINITGRVHQKIIEDLNLIQ